VGWRQEGSEQVPAAISEKPKAWTTWNARPEGGPGKPSNKVSGLPGNDYLEFPVFLSPTSFFLPPLKKILDILTNIYIS
jgi:hypothetical protein